MNRIWIAKVDDKKPQQLEAIVACMDKQTQEWTMQAARGECSWICADCCVSFPTGMPDECAHGHISCTDIIKRDKADAAKEQT